VFPIDFDAIHSYEPDDSGEQNLWAGRFAIFPIRIAAYSPALASPEATVIGRPDGWLAHNLTRDGLRLSEAPPEPAWQDLGGIFTPLAHENTQILAARRF